MAKYIRIVFPTLSALFRVHSASGMYDLDDFFGTESSPQPYHYLNTPQFPHTSEDTDATTHVYTPRDNTSPQVQAAQKTESRDQTAHADNTQGTLVPDLDERPHKCKYCNRTYKNRTNLHRHTRERHFRKVFPKDLACDMCSKKFSSRDRLNRHRKTAHADREKSIPRYECGDCANVFDHPIRFYNHKRAMHPASDLPTEYDCHLCHVKCVSQGGLTRHISAMHTENVMALVNPPQRYTCHHCNMGFSAKSSLTRHVNTVHIRRVIAMDALKSKRDYVPAGKYLCESCGMAYTTKTNLRKHKENTHSAWSTSRATASIVPTVADMG